MLANESCLSLPSTTRSRAPSEIRAALFDHENEIREIEAKGLLATCLQHEMTLDGVPFCRSHLDLKRGISLRKLAKTKRSRAWRPA